MNKTGLKTIREDRDLSQSGLAKATGTTIRMIQQYEQKQRDINGAKLLTLLKLCNVLGCRLSDILDDPETLAELARYTERQANKQA